MCPPILFPEKLQLYGFIGTACASRTELIGQCDSYSLSCPLSITKDHAVWKIQQEDLQGFITHSPANACPRNKPRLQAFYSSKLMKHQFRIIIRLLTPGHSTFLILWILSREGCFLIASRSVSGGGSWFWRLISLDSFILAIRSHEHDSLASTKCHSQFHKPLLYCYRSQCRGNSVHCPDNLHYGYQTLHEAPYYQGPWMGRL